MQGTLGTDVDSRWRPTMSRATRASSYYIAAARGIWISVTQQ